MIIPVSGVRVCRTARLMIPEAKTGRRRPN